MKNVENEVVTTNRRGRPRKNAVIEVEAVEQKQEVGKESVSNDLDYNALGPNDPTYRERLRSVIGNVYDIQKLRIQMGNRLVASLGGLSEESHRREDMNKKILQMTDEERKEYFKDKEDFEDKNKVKIDKKLNLINAEYRRITDEISERAKKDYDENKKIRSDVFKRRFKELNDAEGFKYIRSYIDYQMALNYNKMLNLESEASKPVESMVKAHPMWDAFFKDVCGCGYMMGGVCLAYLDPAKARHASSFWKYCGLDVLVDTEGNPVGHDRKFSVQVEYVSKSGEVKTKNSLGYSPFLKSKILEVLGGSILKQCVIKDKDGNKTYKGYAKAYADYLNRLNNHEKKKDYTAYHKHRMAMRFMIKQFVRDMWYVWRDLCGYQLEDPYEVAFLGRKHHGYNEAVDLLLDQKLLKVPADLMERARQIADEQYK